MKAMKPQEIRSMTVTEIKFKIDELSDSLQNLLLQHAQKQLANPVAIRQTKLDIARLKTIVKEMDAASQSKAVQTTAHKGQK
jgi:large subunit ribosomal protein L29